MLTENEVEELIILINNGFDLELLSFEFGVPMEQLQIYKERLELRKFAKESLRTGKFEDGIQALKTFIVNSQSNIVEKMMLIKLKAYAQRENINEKDLKAIEEERKRIGFSRNIDELLEELNLQIPKRKNSNLRKKEKKMCEELQTCDEEVKPILQESKKKSDYKLVIERYKKEIAKNPQNSLNKRNLLSYAYFRAGRIAESREELQSLIKQTGSYTAYRQLIHLEICEGNFDDAKLWAYDSLDKFPNSVDIRTQLISIAKKEKDTSEVIKQLKEIIKINPASKKANEKLEKMNFRER